MGDMETVFSEREETQKAVRSEMIRQYKTMQTDMILKTHNLEHELQVTRNKLGSQVPLLLNVCDCTRAVFSPTDQVSSELKKVKEEKERLEKDKNEEITQLKTRIDLMESHFHRILMVRGFQCSR